MVREVGHRLRARVSSADYWKQDENGRNTLWGTSARACTSISTFPVRINHRHNPAAGR